MKVKTSQGEGSKSYYTGIGEFKVMMFNPTRSELNKIFGKEDSDTDKELEYFKENDEVKTWNEDGTEGDSIFCDRVNVTAWCREVSTDSIFPITFRIYKTPEKSKTGKVKVVNQHGKSIYVDSVENAPDFLKFTPGKIKQPLEYRRAFKGEAEFMEFLACWVNVNPFEAEDNSLFPENQKRFWAGDMSEINSLVANLENNTVMAGVFVKKKEDTDEEGNTVEKVYNNVSTRAFCTGSKMKYFRNYHSNNFEGLSKSSKVGTISMYDLANFIEQLFGEYGVKDFLLKAPITVYSDDLDPVNKEAVVTNEDPGY
jgi:hypothetical protein